MLVPHLRREKPLPFPTDMGKRLPPDKQEIVMLERLVTYLVKTYRGTNLAMPYEVPDGIAICWTG